MYFNENANWDGKEKEVENGSELAFGAEFAVSNALTLSGGYLMATAGAKDSYQTDLSYSLNSNTFGLGARYMLNPGMGITLAYSNTSYEEGSRSGFEYTDGVSGSETYMKTATVFALGLTKSF